jgi:hypothetical protein
MKKLFSQTERGYSWSNQHTYYLCESEEEYNKVYADAIAEIKRQKSADLEPLIDNGYIKSCYSRNIGRSVEIGNITAQPQTQVSDGFATSGGIKLEANGVTFGYLSGTSSMDYSSYAHYIKPNSIKNLSSEKVEHWWV